MGLSPAFRSAEAALLVHKGLPDEDRVRMALGLYSLHRTVQVCRHAPKHDSLDRKRLFKIYLQRAADNSKARNLLRFETGRA